MKETTFGWSLFLFMIAFSQLWFSLNLIEGVFERSHFLSGEKVCKDPLGTFRMVLRPSRRLKGYYPLRIPGADGDGSVFCRLASVRMV